LGQVAPEEITELPQGEEARIAVLSVAQNWFRI
jgi:hypothetical protein